MHGSCAVYGRCNGKSKSVADHGSELHMRTKCSLNVEVISHKCLETVLCILRYKILYIEELGNNGNKACTDCLNNFISPTRHQRHGGQTPWSTYRTHATWIVQYADLWRHCLTLDLSGTVGCLLHQYLVLRAANDQWQDQTTEKRSEALIGWDIGERNRREC